MSFDGLARVLRGLFWGLLYVGTVCAAVLVFAPAGGAAFIAWACILVVIAHDAHNRFSATPKRSG